MRIKMDENLPQALVPILESLGHDKRFLITQDLDFSDARKYQPGMYEGLLLLRLAQPGRKALTSRIAGVFATELAHEWKGNNRDRDGAESASPARKRGRA